VDKILAKLTQFGAMVDLVLESQAQPRGAPGFVPPCRARMIYLRCVVPPPPHSARVGLHLVCMVLV